MLLLVRPAVENPCAYSRRAKVDIFFPEPPDPPDLDPRQPTGLGPVIGGCLVDIEISGYFTDAHKGVCIHVRSPRSALCPKTKGQRSMRAELAFLAASWWHIVSRGIAWAAIASPLGFDVWVCEPRI